MFYNELYTYVLNMLSANHDSCNRVDAYYKPEKYFIIGTLADSSKDWAVGEPTTKMQSKTAIRHNSLSIMFLINRQEKSPIITVTPSCSIFYKVFPTFEEQTTHFRRTGNREDPGFTTVYKKFPCKFAPIKFDLSAPINSQELIFEDIISNILEDNDIYRLNKEVTKNLDEKIRNSFDPAWLEDEHTYQKIINELKEKKIQEIYHWQAEIRCERESFNNQKDMITIRFINTTKESNRYYTFLFNCGLNIHLHSLKLKPFEYTFRHEGYEYNKNKWIRALNCHAQYDETKKLIKTKPYDVFEQEKRIPRTEVNGIAAKFPELKSSILSLERILEELKLQVVNYKNHPNYKDKTRKHHVQFKKETNNFETIINRFEEGVYILKQNKYALKSFQNMNKVFEIAAQDQFDSWRLFQIVFIVMNIPAIIDSQKQRDFVDVIHVDTGGGKSEAYFGLVIFLLFWDRYRGKNKGVSAFTKFPLRMLSIQQLQRIAKLLVIAEDIKNRASIPGEPFSLGYYVGITDDFPRKSLGKREEIIKKQKKGEKVLGILLDYCPFCSSEIYLDIEEESKKIIHFCPICSKKYYLYFTNEEIYRSLPSFIVSTVDKLASVALNRRFKVLLGGKISLCPKHGFVPINDKCEVDLEPNVQCSEIIQKCEQIEGPTLMIQDEMHLIREGFGTINSHFEGLLNQLLFEFSQKEFKYITMTATVAGASHQIDHLYAKETFIFPGSIPRGYDKNKDFFFETIFDTKKNKPLVQRILIGLKPNLRDNQFASLLTIYHIAQFIKEVKNDLEGWALKLNITLPELREELHKYQAILTYHGKKADVFGMNYYIHPVVESKLEDISISSQTLTGDNNLVDIKNIINKIESFSQKFPEIDRLHSTFATSIVSHGVDIDNWNLMIFQGMTNNTSEYIQALSRVGRKHVGIVFLWYYPNRIRDLSYYKNFLLYHEILGKKIEKTPISRWTKLGFKQTFTSIFCGAILNYMSDLLEMPIYKVDEVNNIFDDENNREKLINFLKAAYYSDMDRLGAKWVHQNISIETERRLNYLARTRSPYKNFFPNALADCDDPYFKTQYGMRGIQAEVKLDLGHNFIPYIKKMEESM